MKDLLLHYSTVLEDVWWMLQALRESRHAIYSEASNQLVAGLEHSLNTLLREVLSSYSHSQQASNRYAAGASLTLLSLPSSRRSESGI